jgi:hypothetical protein
MLTALKEFLRYLLPAGLFAGMLAVAAYAAARRAEVGIFLLAVFASLPTLWYPTHQFPLGKDSIDILIFATFVGIIINKGGFERTPGIGLLAAVVLTSYIAVWNSSLRFGLALPITTGNPVLGDWKNFCEMILLYWLVYNAIKTEDHQKTLIVIIAMVVLVIAFREFRNFSAGDGFDYDRRAQGPFWIVGLGANHLGAFIAHSGALLAGLLLVDRNTKRRWLYAAGLLFSLHPLFFAYSRGAYLAALVVLGVLGVVRSRLLLVPLVALVFTWQVVLPDSVVERITMTETAEGRLESSAAERVVLWEHAKELFANNPIFGIGFNGFELSRRGEELRDTHNFYLKVACEQGVIGLLLLAAVLLRALWTGWRLYLTGRSDFHRGLGLGFFASVFAVAVTNIFGDRFSYFALGAFFWMSYGAVQRALTLAHAAPAAGQHATRASDPQPSIRSS